MYVSKTRSGIPTFLPPFSRRRVREGNHLVIKYVFSIFTLYKSILVWPKVRFSPKTIHVRKNKLTERTRSVCEWLYHCGQPMIEAYTDNRYKRYPLELGFRYLPIRSSGPNTTLKPGLDLCYSEKELGGRRLSTWHTLPADALGILTRSHPMVIASLGKFWFSNRTHIVEDGKVAPLTEDDQGGIRFINLIRRLSLCYAEVYGKKMRTMPENGRLGLKLEGARKLLRANAHPFSCWGNR